jgi:gliding motility-associated-like protein
MADTFYYTLSGTAANGVDYSLIGDSIYFAVGQDSSYLTINSLPDALLEGTETVTLTCYASTPCGGNDTVSLTLHIIDTPPLTVHLNNDTTLLCPFQNLPLTATPGGGVAIGNYTYLWTNTLSTSDTAQVNPVVTTTYYVTVSDSCGNTANDSVTIHVVPYVPMVLTLNNDTTICGGNEVLLDANVTLGLPDYIYSWSPNISLIDSATVHPANSTTYILTVTDNCGSTISDTVDITVFPIHAEFGYNFPTNQNAQFVDQSNGASSYFWNFGDGSNDSVSILENPSHDYLNDGTYTVTLITINPQGCADTVVHTIVVLPDFYFYFPNAFTPNSNGLNDTYKGFGVGIKKYHMQIFDRWGERIFETTDINVGWDGTYKGAKAPSAVYVVVFDLEGYHWEVKRYIGSITLVH